MYLYPASTAEKVQVSVGKIDGANAAAITSLQSTLQPLDHRT